MFMVYNRDNGRLFNAYKPFCLAGYNLIYQLWNKRGKPLDQGWHMSADDLIQISGNGNINTTAFLIDFHPKSRTRIGIIELLDIYAYTYSHKTNKDGADWTPMMLKLRDVFYEEYLPNISDSEKKQKIEVFDDVPDKEDFIEFLYLNGSDKGWNWGANGMTNAAFIEKHARDYFRHFF